MPLDPRIALQGIGFEAPDILGAVRQGQDIRKNQMAMQRARDAGIALSNFMAPPPAAEVAPVAAPANAMGAGRGPAITGQPLPPANAMASPAPRPRRDVSALLPYAGDNGPVDAAIAQHNREEAAAAQAAARAVDDKRLGNADERARVDFTVNQSLPHWGFASRNPTDEALIAARDRTLAIPGVDPGLVNQNYAIVMGLPFEERAVYMADVSNNYGSARAAEAERQFEVDNFNAGDRITFRPRSGRARLPGDTPPDIAVSLTPGQRLTQENRAEDQDREWQAEYDSRYDDLVEADTRRKLARNPQDMAEAEANYGAALALFNAHTRTRPGGGGPPRASDGPPPRPGAGNNAVGRGNPPPTPPAGTPAGATRSNARGTWTWDGSRWQ